MLTDTRCALAQQRRVGGEKALGSKGEDDLIRPGSWGVRGVVPRSTDMAGPTVLGPRESESTRRGPGREFGGERGGAGIVTGGVE